MSKKKQTFVQNDIDSSNADDLRKSGEQRLSLMQKANSSVVENSPVSKSKRKFTDISNLKVKQKDSKVRKFSWVSNSSKGDDSNNLKLPSENNLTNQFSMSLKSKKEFDEIKTASKESIHIPISVNEDVCIYQFLTIMI